MRIAILGYGREGKSVLKFLKKLPRFRGAEVWIIDKRKAPVPPQIKASFGKNYLKNLSKFDLVFRSPGIPYNLPQLKKARRGGVEFSSATKLFFDHCRAHTIGITGTKGKGTTSTLLYKILKSSNIPAHLAGNIGTSMLELLPKIKKGDRVVLELSSFQLQDLGVSPHTAVVLDIFPDHQDAHLNLKEYYDAKTNIARHQKRGDKIFFFKNHPLSRWVASKGRGKKIAVDEKKLGLFGPANLRVIGGHNFKNVVMAATVARELGAPSAAIAHTARNFRGLEHRLEFVRRIEKIQFWNDSASTNPHTTAAAILAFSDKRQATRNLETISHVPYPMSLILIAGGQDKKLNYAPLARALKTAKGKVPLIILFGENRRKIARAIEKSTRHEAGNREHKSRIIAVGDLSQAVKKAYAFAKQSMPHDHASCSVILFSPGAASFDMFKNYADRGEQFKRIVHKLAHRR